MKSIFDMSEDEILELKPEDVELQIKLKMAEEGTPFPEEPTYLEILPEPEPTESFFTCGMFSDSYGFQDQEDCVEVIEALKNFHILKQDYDYSVSYNRRYVTRVESDTDDCFLIKHRKYFSRAEYDRSVSVFSDNDSRREGNKALRNKYKNQMKEEKKIRDSVLEVYNVAVEGRKIKDKYLTLYQEYFILADRNAEIAMAFLKKAYEIGDDEIRYVLARFIEPKDEA